ncbi:MAG TPA: MG2 domain-containing protein, partial [Bacteroidota bacterium]|nr:MG2 domain-containing protein [Bacteroidota bacterium]
MRPIKTTSITLLLCLIALSCSTQDATRLKLTSPLPSGIVGRDTVLAFSFSRGMVPPDSLNTWTTSPLVEFKPSIPGKFVWQDTARLLFSPDGPLPGDAKITGRFNTPLLVALAKATGFSGPEEFQFSTMPFTLRGAEFFYDRLSESRQVGIKANLEFSYAVDPQDLAGKLTVTVDGAAQSAVKVMTTERSRVVPVELGPVTQLDKERKISVSVAADLQSPETNTKITQDRPFEFTLPALGELKIYGHEAGFDGVQGFVLVRTSQEVDAATVKSFVRLEPNIDFSVTAAGSSFTLHGNFQPGTTMKMTIAAGLESYLGGKTQNPYEADVFIGSIPASFRFGSESGVYMLLGGEKKLEIVTVNLPKLLVKVSQVFQNNLVYFIQNGRFYDYDYSDDEGDDSPGARRKYRYYLGNYGRSLSVDTLTIAGPENQQVSTYLNLDKYMHTGYKGFYLIEISNLAESWRSTSKLVSVSDLAIITKRNPDGAMVFVTSLETAKPVSGAQVSLVSTNNQIVAAGKTDGDGVARFTDLQSKSRDFPLQLVTAELENDFNFLTFDDYRVETSRFDVGGKRDNQTVYDALMYGDRNLYRPGETMIVSGIVRNLSESLPASMPVRLKVINPRGSTVGDQQLTLNADGAFETSFATRANSLTGEYHCELYAGNGAYLASYKASVEEFMPDRLRVNLTPSAERAKAGASIQYQLSAHNFFGPPAAGKSWQFEGSFDPMPYVSKAYPAFRFSNDAIKPKAMEPVQEEGKTDQNGAASFTVTVPGDLQTQGTMRLRGRVAVFDESGRPVYQGSQTILDPASFYLGVHNTGPYYVTPGVPQKIQIVAVDPGDRPIRGFRARIAVIRYEWHSVLRQYGNDKTLRYVSERREIPERNDVVTIGDGPADFTYAVPRSGEYVVRVSKDGDSGFNEFRFYSYSWGSTDVTSFQVDPEARVDIVLDKAAYAPGDKAHILFQAPFPGTMLVTVERNGVLNYHYLEVVNNAASLDLPVEEKYLPNVYISAVLFRKIKELDIPLLAGHGFVPLMVEKPSNKLELTIKAPAAIRPRTKQSITIAVGGEKNVALTLAAVDEGILQLKNYKTPDPYGYFYARKALETDTYDFFRDLIPEAKKQVSSTGGSEAELGRHVNPLSVQRVKPVAFWSGIKHTNGSGEVQIDIDIPDFNGEIRLMAVAYKGDRFGATQQAMTVADPIVITPALPRFLSPGDSLSMAITAFNTTARPADLRFAVRTEGGVKLTDPPPALTVGANQEQYTLAGLRAGQVLGKATVIVKTSTPEGEIESKTDLPVRPASPLVTETITGAVEAGGTVQQQVPDVYYPEGRRAYVTLSPFPVANFAGRLKDLVGYPYGCLEQIVSKAFPQIYLRDLAAIMAPSAVANGSPMYFVNEAIGIIGSLQSPDGSFVYWPGGTYTNPWGTIYATHFLVEARKAGYAVPDGVLKSALGAIASLARSRKTMDYYYWDQGKVVVRRIADKSSLYALYVLASASAADRALMDFYRGDQGLLTLDSRSMLAAAYALSGDRRTYGELMPDKFALEQSARTTGGVFDSPIRANAIILNMLLETDLNNINIPRYMDYLSQRYKEDAWFSTQDDAFTLLAFGKAARMAAAAKITGTVKAGSKEYAYKGGSQRFDVDPFGASVTITTSGEGRAYYSIVTEGIRTDGQAKLEDRNLQVRREFLDRVGNPINVASVKQNDLVIVRVRLLSAIDMLENVAVSDLLPAGFELENPRLTEMASYTFVKDGTTPEYLDVRDDRINFFTS